MYFIIGFLFVLFPAISFAIFEDNFSNAKSLGMSNSFSDYSEFYKLNPSLSAQTRDLYFESSYIYGHITQQGEKNYKNFNIDLLSPARIKTKNITWGLGYDLSYGDFFNEKKLFLNFSSWHLFEQDEKVLDFGFNIKSLNLNKGNLSENHFSLDLGSVLRHNQYLFGFSILNINSPKFTKGIIYDNAPRIIKIGISRKEEDFSFSADLTKRNSIYYGPSYSINTGFEYFWRTYKSGVFNTLFGLSLGDNKSMINAGFGYKNMASEIIYSFSLPLSRPFSLVNGISFILRFGERNIENEYEKIIKREMKYRKDLMDALEESEKREKELKEQLLSMQEELGKLNDALKEEKIKKSEIEEAKNRLNDIVEKQRNDQEELKILEEKNRLDKIKRLESSFNMDWENYIRIKNSGASKDVLIGLLRKIISQYHGQGIDISLATIEMQKLLR